MGWRRRHRYRGGNYHSLATPPQEGAKYGDIEFTWKDGGTPACKFNKIAHSGRSELLMVSLIAESHRIKQIRAALAPNPKGTNRVSIIAGGVRTNRPGEPDWYANTPGRLTPSVEGYICYQSKLGYGLAHAVFVTKTPGFMLVMSEESLWQELNTTRFTTPLLREWMPYIEKKLREYNRLENAHVFGGCQCGILTASTKKLDEIVLEGLTDRHIAIPSLDSGLASPGIPEALPAVAVA